MTKQNYRISFSNDNNKAATEEVVTLIAKYNKDTESRDAINKLEGIIHGEYVLLGHSTVYELTHTLESISCR